MMIQKLKTSHKLLLMLMLGIAPLGIVYIMEHVYHYYPCQLCNWQRLPWWILVVSSLSGLILTQGKTLTLWVLISIIALFIGGMVGLYHAGVEWHFWQGLSSCSVDELQGSLEDIQKKLFTRASPPCDEAPFRFLGLSLAFYNAIASFITIIILWKLLYRKHA